MAALNYRVLFYYRLLVQSGHFHDDVLSVLGARNGWAIPRIVVEEDLCIGCGACEQVCPPSTIGIWDATAHVTSPVACATCLTTPCLGACPTDAFTVLRNP